jgi:uncharacterized protein (TIGR00369 family)
LVTGTVIKSRQGAADGLLTSSKIEPMMPMSWLSELMASFFQHSTPEQHTMNPMTLSGLALLQAMQDGLLPKPSISETIPMQGVALAAGMIRMHVQADHRHLNPLGGVHGGFAATVLDSVTGCAIHTLLEAGVGYGTVDLNVKMLRPIPPHVELIAEGRVLNLSHTIGIAEGDIKSADGKIYAHATCTCVIQRRPSTV